jgi:hypothetical protein
MAALQGNPNHLFLEFMLIFSSYKPEVSENWDDDFEFQEKRRKMLTATAKSEATENWKIRVSRPRR